MWLGAIAVDSVVGWCMGLMYVGTNPQPHIAFGAL